MTKTSNFFKDIFSQSKTMLAPMAGSTNLPYRLLLKELSCKIFVTEMVSAKGLYYNSNKTIDIMKTLKEEHEGVYTGVQIFGSDKDIMARVVEEYINDTLFDFIDINMGCPVKKIVNNGDGSALLKDPIKAGEIVSSIKKVSTKPVSVKIRTGFDFDSLNVEEMVRALEDAGADMIAVHGRTRSQMYTGYADLKEIEKAVLARKNIPLVGNGDICVAEDAIKMMEKTGCDAVMIGRGANYNPFIFKQVEDLLNGESFREYSDIEKINIAKRHFEILLKHTSHKKTINEFRKYLYWYIKGMKNSAKIRSEINKLSTKEDVFNLIEEVRINIE